MQAAIATLAVASLVGVGGLLALGVLLWRMHRESRHDSDELRALDHAAAEANHATTRANAQLHEVAAEYADYRRRSERQLAHLQEEIDALEKRLRESLARGNDAGAVARGMADGLRRLRESAVRRATGVGAAGAPRVSDDAAAGADGGRRRADG